MRNHPTFPIKNSFIHILYLGCMKRKFVIVMAVVLVGILSSAPLSGVYVQKMCNA